jgi:ATP-binding cassette subfamily A (ABC1) protein 3
MTNVIKSYVPSAKLENNVGAELSYILPHESSHKFEEMFSFENEAMFQCLLKIVMTIF